jgi:hypothetical protein
MTVTTTRKTLASLRRALDDARGEVASRAVDLELCVMLLRAACARGGLIVPPAKRLVSEWMVARTTGAPRARTTGARGCVLDVAIARARTALDRGFSLVILRATERALRDARRAVSAYRRLRAQAMIAVASERAMLWAQVERERAKEPALVGAEPEPAAWAEGARRAQRRVGPGVKKIVPLVMATGVREQHFAG